MKSRAPVQDGLFKSPERPRWLYCVALVVLIVAGAAARIGNLGGIGRRTPDENTYAWESDAIADSGVAGIRSLVERFQKDPSLFQYPTPVRAGYLWMQAAVVRLTGYRDARAGAVLSCAAGIGTLILLGILGWRWLSPSIALASVCLFAFSPPVLAMARRAWQESVVGFWAALLLLVGLASVRRKNSWCWMVAAGMLAGFSLTIKEISFVNSGLVSALLGIFLVRQAEWRRLAVFATSLAASCVLSVVWMAYLLGGLTTLISFASRSFASAGSSESSVVWQSGSVFDWIATLWLCDPVTFTLGFLGLILGIVRTTKRGNSAASVAVCWCSATVLVFLTLPLLSPHHLNVRFVCPAFAPLCLLSGVAARETGAGIRGFSQPNERRWTAGFALAVFLSAIFINYRSFEEKFVDTDLQDLSLRMLQGPGP